MRRLLVPIAALGLALAACVPPVPSNDRLIEFDPITTTMGRIQEDGVLRAGVPDDGGPFSGTGFARAIAQDAADALGVDLEVVSGSDEQLQAMVDGGEIDVAYPLFPITEKAVRKNAFADPYWVGHQRILAVDPSITDIDDLSGRSVCQSIDDITGVPVEELVGDVTEIVTAPQPSKCPEVDAIVAPDIRLLALLGADGDLVGEQMTTTGYGAMVGEGDTPFAEYLSTQLAEAKVEGRWRAWYEDFISPLIGGVTPDPPGLHVEEAAALYPVEG